MTQTIQTLQLLSRSAARLADLLETDAPEVLIENEERLLCDRWNDFIDNKLAEAMPDTPEAELGQFLFQPDQ